MSKWLNEHKAASTVIVILVLALALGVVMMTGRHEPVAEGEARAPTYYYDLTSGQLFVSHFATVLPIKAPSDAPDGADRNGVRAYVFACGDCGDESQRFVGYLESMSPEARDFLEGKGDPNNLFGREGDLEDIGRIQADPEAKPLKWFAAGSEGGARVRETPVKRCGATPPTACTP